MSFEYLIKKEGACVLTNNTDNTLHGTLCIYNYRYVHDKIKL